MAEPRLTHTPERWKYKQNTPTPNPNHLSRALPPLPLRLGGGGQRGGARVAGRVQTADGTDAGGHAGAPGGAQARSSSHKLGGSLHSVNAIRECHSVQRFLQRLRPRLLRLPLLQRQLIQGAPPRPLHDPFTTHASQIAILSTLLIRLFEILAPQIRHCRCRKHFSHFFLSVITPPKPTPFAWADQDHGAQLDGGLGVRAKGAPTVEALFRRLVAMLSLESIRQVHSS
jgi:hypothetical protein